MTTPVLPKTEAMSRKAVRGKEKNDATSSAFRTAAVESSESTWRITETVKRVVTTKLETQ